MVKFKIVVSCLACLLAICASAALADDAQSCGEVVSASGGFGVVRQDRYLALAPGAPVYQFDIVRTEADGSGSIRFIDGTMLDVRSSSEIHIKEVVSEEGRDRFNVGVIEGAARAVTGAIVRRNPRGVKLTTPGATIGIRGTQVDVSYSSTSGGTGVNVIETKSVVAVSHLATGISIVGGTGMSLSLSDSGAGSVVNDVAVDLSDPGSVASAAGTLGGSVSFGDSSGSVIGGSAEAGAGGSSSSSGGSDDSADAESSGSPTDSGPSDSTVDCGSEISSPSR